MSKRKKVVIVLDLILMGAVILMVGYWIAKSESNTLIRLEATAIYATAFAPPIPQVQTTIQFSIRTHKTCYTLHEPIEIQAELVNVGEESVTVLKRLHIFTGGGYYGAIPLVNGKPNRRIPLVLDKREDRRDDYVALLPGEGTITHIPNFLDLLDELDGQPSESATGQYDVAMQYWNWIPNVLRNFDFAFVATHFIFEVYGDRPVWTGLLESNHLIITIVDDPAKCGATATQFP
jgi:hypothetical protein